MSTALTDFLNAHAYKKPIGSHTHTWFAKGPHVNGTGTLCIDAHEVPLLHKALVENVSAREYRMLKSGANSISEKASRGVPFRFFADLDFAAEKIVAWKVANELTDADFLPRLKDKLSEIVALYGSVVGEMCSINRPQSTTQYLLATRLPYKIHLHWPDVIVNAKSAKAISKAFSDRFAQEHPDMFHDDVTDESVYATGVRLLYCHKGSMSKPGKRDAEKRAHEAVFGKDSYSDVYYITNVTTWKQDRTPSVRDLQLTSIQTPIGTLLTKLSITSASSSPKGKAKGKARVTTASNTGNPASEHCVVQQFLADMSTMDNALIRMSEHTIRGETLIVPTRCKDCPFANRQHQSNQQYFVLTRDTAEQRCHDDTCVTVKRYPLNIEAVKNAVASLLGDEQIIELQRCNTREVDRLVAFRGILSEPIGNKCDIAKMNLVPANEKMTPMGYWTCTLPQNRYCPVCRSTHDRPENFMQVSPLGHRGIGCNLRHGEFYPDPLSTIPAATINILFNNTINVNVTNEVEIRDFGVYELFPTLYDDVNINKLCHSSLTGRTRSVAQYAFKLMEGHYIYQDRQWYKYVGTSWHEGIGPDALFTETITRVYEKLQLHFQQLKQVKWLNQLIDELGNVTRRKAFIEDLERIVIESMVRYPLDDKANMLGFKDCVFDSNTGLLRNIESSDYLSHLLPYDVRLERNEMIEREIEQFFIDIMPDEEVRDFLWNVLALHLQGKNAHSIAMVWSGSGGNGKTVLTNLMQSTFKHLYDGQPATFLTTERPSPEKASPLMLSLKTKRCVFASEPESGKKCNTAFIKFITGGDLIQVRDNYSSNYVSYYPRFLVTMLCNEIPNFDGATGEIRGLWRRVKIIKFKTEFTSHPTLPHHRKDDPGLSAKMVHWPPYFMQMLIARYKKYLDAGSALNVPPEVQRNIDEQKEENNPMDTWLQDNLIQSPTSHRIHVHRFDYVYKKWLEQWRKEGSDRGLLGKLPKGGFINKLESLGHTVSSVSEKKRDSGCCGLPNRYVNGINVRGWDKDQYL